ncbi:MAG: hypothetical protein ACKOF9_07255 [Burkholderiales bacterium]
MQPITVTFNEVFDVVKSRGSDGRLQRTQFGFSTSEFKKYGVSVPGFPRVCKGDTVTVLLREQNNWQTLLGWYNHSTSEFALHDYRGLFLVALIFLFAALLFFGLGGGNYGLLLTLFSLLGCGYWGMSAFRAYRVKQKLIAIAKENRSG